MFALYSDVDDARLPGRSCLDDMRGKRLMCVFGDCHSHLADTSDSYITYIETPN